MPRLSILARHAPYDGERLLWFLGVHAVPGLESWDGASYARVLTLPRGPGTLVLRATTGGYDADLRLTHPGDRGAALAGLGHLLDLDGDPGPARRALRRDPLLGPLVSARAGLRVPGSVDHVETLIRTIVGQQVSVAGARTVTGRIVQALGSALPDRLARPEVGLTHAFPTPAALSAAEPAELPMPRARARSIVAVARAVLAEEGPQLADGSEVRRAELLALPGVGPWTAAYQALRAAREPDVFLPTDLGVRRAFEAFGLPGDPASVAARSEAWSPHRSLALMHVWTDLLEARGA